MVTREINIITEYITLGQLLKLSGIINNGGEQKEFLAKNKVLVNNIDENRRGRKLYPNDQIVVKDTTIKVGKEIQ